MPTIDFIYDLDCPNIGLARANLMRAFSRAGVPARWQEHLASDPDAPERVRGYGSPTILVDGRDVASAEPGAQSCCRLYDADGATVGAPPVDVIASALAAAVRSQEHCPEAQSPGPDRPDRFRSTLAVLPGIGVAFVPKLTCPFCWPAYVGVLSATGLTFLMEDKWLMVATTTLLLLAVAALAWRAPTRRGYGPTIAGLLASVVILGGKFLLDSDIAVYGGAAVLFAATIWNAWPRRSRSPGCSSCVPQT